MKQMKIPSSTPSMLTLPGMHNNETTPIVENAFKKTQQIFDNNSMINFDQNPAAAPVGQAEKVKLVQEQIRRQHKNHQRRSISKETTANNNNNNNKLNMSPAGITGGKRSANPENGLIDHSEFDAELNQIQNYHKNLENQSKPNNAQTKFQDLIRQLKAKIYFKQWRKFMPSRVLKILGTWHYNLLSDKTIGFDSDRKYFENFFQDNKDYANPSKYQFSNGNNGASASAHGAGALGAGGDEAYYNSELRSLNGGSDQRFQSLRFLKQAFEMIPLISASGNFRLMWDIVQMVIIMAFQCFLPLYITFKVPFYDIVPTAIAYCMYFLLLFDIFVNMNTSYYEKGKQITDRKRIIIMYLKTAFVMDILPIIPITIDFLFVSIEESILRYILLIFVVKLKRMYVILNKIQDRFHLIASINSYMQLFKLLIMHLLISHYFACLWLIIGRTEDDYSWLVKRNIDTDQWPTQYINSYYFITLTMITVGYGDITPVTSLEIGVCIGIMTFACGVFAYSVNEIGTLIQDLRSNQKEIHSNLQTIQKYMHNKNISNELKYEIREYLLYYWTEESNKNGEKENTIINQLSDSLKETLVIEANHLVLSDSPVFRDNFSPEILKRTVPLITEFRCTPEEVIYCEGETDEGCIYFIEKGSIEIYIDISTGSSEQFKPLKQLKKGDNFGAIGFFSGLHRTQSVRSLEFTTLLMIKRNEFLKLLREYPQDYERFCQLRDKIMVQHDYQKLGLRCYSCQSFYHVLNDCPYLHYVANRFRVIHNSKTGENKRDNSMQRVNIIRYRRTLSIQSEIEQQARIYYEENEELIEYLYDHLETTQNENPSSFMKMESIGGIVTFKEIQPEVSLGQEEDVKSQSIKGPRRTGKHRNTLLPALPQIRTRQSYDENAAAVQQAAAAAQQAVGQQMMSIHAPPQPSVEPRRGERKGTIQIVNHRAMNMKLSRIASTEIIPKTAAQPPLPQPSLHQQQSQAVGGMFSVEKSMERLPTEKNLTQFATTQNLESEFIIVAMDQIKVFTYYFPHNNFNRVIANKNKEGKRIVDYLRNKRRSKRSTIRSTNKVETSSLNSLFNKFEQQRDSDENMKGGPILQQQSYFKSLSKGTNFSQRHSMKHNSNFSLKSNANTLRSRMSSNNNLPLQQAVQLEDLNDGDDDYQNGGDQSGKDFSFHSEVDLTLSCPAVVPNSELENISNTRNQLQQTSWGFQSFGQNLKINHFEPNLHNFEERNQVHQTV